MAQRNFLIAASTDDTYFRAAPDVEQFSAVSSPQSVGNSAAGSTRLGAGLRFATVAIPKGATITAAHIMFTSATLRNGAPCNLRISANKAANPAAPTSIATFKTAYGARTTAIVDWDNVAVWAASATYETPDIATVIQELVNQATWASGNAMLLFVEDYDGRSAAGAHRQFATMNAATPVAVELHVTYKAVGIARFVAIGVI